MKAVDKNKLTYTVTHRCFFPTRASVTAYPQAGFLTMFACPLFHFLICVYVTCCYGTVAQATQQKQLSAISHPKGQHDAVKSSPASKPISPLEAEADTPLFPCDHKDLSSLLDDPLIHAATFSEAARPDLAHAVFDRILRTKRARMMFSGSSITAMGYFAKFTDALKSDGINVTIANLGVGASSMAYHLYCVDMSKAIPDVIFVEHAFTQWAEPIQGAEALFRKFLHLTTPSQIEADSSSTSGTSGSSSISSVTSTSTSGTTTPLRPLLVFINLVSVNRTCPQHPMYHDLILHYGMPVIDFCYLQSHCFMGKNAAHWVKYSADRIHPNGPHGPKFLGQIMKYWWDDQVIALKSKAKDIGPSSEQELMRIPEPLYRVNAITTTARCATVTNSSDIRLVPLGQPVGFELKTRTKFGTSFNNVKQYYESSTVGDYIEFPFTGSKLLVTIYQNPRGMGVMGVTIDGDRRNMVNVTGYCKPTSISSTNGVQSIVTVMSNLDPKVPHIARFEVLPQPGNPEFPGHSCQIIALLYNDAAQGN